MKLWIDEDLSPSLVAVCHEAGYEATSVRDRGKLSAKDHALAQILLDEGWVLVTNNAGDFLKLAKAAGLHPGLVFVELGAAQTEREWLAAAIAHIEHRVKDAKEAARAYGVVMDTVYSSGAATLVALADGTTSLYLSSGGGTIGARQHESVAAATRRLVAMAEEAVDGIPSATDDAMPPPGAATIRVLTYGGPHAVTAPEDDFGNGRHELSSLFHAAQRRILAIDHPVVLPTAGAV